MENYSIMPPHQNPNLDRHPNGNFFRYPNNCYDAYGRNPEYYQQPRYNQLQHPGNVGNEVKKPFHILGDISFNSVLPLDPVPRNFVFGREQEMINYMKYMQQDPYRNPFAMQEHYNAVRNSMPLSDSIANSLNRRKRDAINAEYYNCFREKQQPSNINMSMPMMHIEEREIELHKKMLKR